MGVAVQLQAQVTVTGKVIDEQQQPVPYANIVLLSLPDSAFVAGSISNEEGAFSLNVKETKEDADGLAEHVAVLQRPLVAHDALKLVRSMALENHGECGCAGSLLDKVT